MVRHTEYMWQQLFFSLSALATIFSSCNVQAQTPPYTVINNQGPEINTVILECRDSMTLDINSPVFLLNGTDITEKITGYIRHITTLTFVITRELEGYYSCGPDVANASPSSITLIARPQILPPSELASVTLVKKIVGERVALPPIVAPGALIQQYFIDWQNVVTLQTIANIVGPRGGQSVEPLDRYSVDPDTFALTISPVRFEDRGSYLGVVGAMEPIVGGSSSTYTQTTTQNVTLQVIVPPFFVEGLVDKVTSDTYTTFTCRVEGFPVPEITWRHNGDQVMMSEQSSERYQIDQTVNMNADSPPTVESTLKIRQLRSEDSGNVECIAELTTGEEVFSNQSTSQLSVLGNLDSFTTFITTSDAVVLRVFLLKPLLAEVQLFIQYTDADSGENWNMTTRTRYVRAEEITFIDETVPFNKFQVAVALVSGSQKSPILQDPVIYEKPRDNSLVVVLAPCAAGLLVVVTIVCAVVAIYRHRSNINRKIFEVTLAYADEEMRKEIVGKTVYKLSGVRLSSVNKRWNNISDDIQRGPPPLPDPRSPTPSSSIEMKEIDETQQPIDDTNVTSDSTKVKSKGHTNRSSKEKNEGITRKQAIEIAEEVLSHYDG